MLKDKVELFLNTYASNHPDVTVTVAKKSTGVYKNGIYQMYIYYRSDAIRVSVKPGTTQHGEYASLLRDHLVYQKDSANPYEPNSFAFFIDENDIATVLQRLLESQTLPTNEQMAEFAAHAQQYKENMHQRQRESERTVLVGQNGNSSDATMQVADNAVLSSELKQDDQIDTLKQMPYKDISKLFYNWLTANGVSPVSASTNVSDCFYVWRKEAPARFWTMIESEDSISRAILHEALSKFSTANPERVIAGYLRAVQRFRGFVASLSDADGIITSQAEAPHLLATQQTLAESTMVPAYNVEGSPSPHNTPQQRVVIHHSEDNRRIEKKLDSLIGAIATMYSGKSTMAEPEKPNEEVQDRQFRLEPTQGNAPLLMLRKPTSITGLIFTLRLYGIGLDDNSEQYRVFFTTSNGEQLSEAQVIKVVAGGEYNCRFELKSSASEEQTLYLAVQSINAVVNEARQLIEFPVKIAFAADFGL